MGTAFNFKNFWMVILLHGGGAGLIVHALDNQ